MTLRVKKSSGLPRCTKESAPRLSTCSGFSATARPQATAASRTSAAAAAPWRRIVVVTSTPREHTQRGRLELTAGQGLEPQLPVPETGVLPLDDPAKDSRIVATV